jgi:hypothetical protein
MTAPDLSQDELVHVRAFGLASPTEAAELLERQRLRTAAVLPNQIELRAEQLRARLAPAPVEGFQKTPDQMIDDLEWAKHGTGLIAMVLRQARRDVKDTQKLLREARAHVLQRSSARSSDMRQAEVDLECAELIDAFEDAQIVLEFAKDVAKAAEATGSMTQTQAGLIKAQMALAGTGREA